MTHFHKKPVVIEARQFDASPASAAEIIDWAAAHDVTVVCGHDGQEGQVLLIPTLEGDLTASPGDWIIRGVKGEFYPCKPDIFAATYEVAFVNFAKRFDFGGALCALKSGKRVGRAGWNGKGMWLVLCDFAQDTITFPEFGDNTRHRKLPWIGMKTADGGFVPWLASQTDMLADDWMVVEDAKE